MKILVFTHVGIKPVNMANVEEHVIWLPFFYDKKKKAINEKLKTAEGIPPGHVIVGWRRIK